MYIADSVLDERGERMKYMLDLRMLTFTGATGTGWVSWVQEPGFKILRIHKDRGFCALIEAVVTWIVLMPQESCCMLCFMVFYMRSPG